MRFNDAIQRGAEIRDASEGDTIPGDPDHGRWQPVHSGGGAEPAQPHGHPITPPPVEVGARFNLPQRALPPISVAPDSLRQYSQRGTNIPQRRTIGPNPL